MRPPAEQKIAAREQDAMARGNGAPQSWSETQQTASFASSASVSAVTRLSGVRLREDAKRNGTEYHEGPEGNPTDPECCLVVPSDGIDSEANQRENDDQNGSHK